MYIFEHWRPKWVKLCTAKRDRKVQASYAKPSSGVHLPLPFPATPLPCALFRNNVGRHAHYSAQGLSAHHCADRGV